MQHILYLAEIPAEEFCRFDDWHIIRWLVILHQTHSIFGHFKFTFQSIRFSGRIQSQLAVGGSEDLVVLF